MQYHMPGKYCKGKRNPCWTGLFQSYQIACIFCCHHIHQSIRSSSHLLCQLFHWNLVQMPVLIRSIWEVCWKRTLYLHFCYQQIYLKLYLFLPLNHTSAFLFLPSKPLVITLSFFADPLTLSLIHIWRCRRRG